MAKISIESEILSNHTDEEVVEYLDSILTGLLKNYRVALEKGQSEVLWGNLGDVTLVAAIIREMKKRNATRQAQRNTVV